jgi:hypothetical protein
MKYKTYREEQTERDAARVKHLRKYRYMPVMFDKFYSKNTPETGQIVVKTQPHGCPRNGTMGMCYVADLEGQFIGMVCVNSLQAVKNERK